MTPRVLGTLSLLALASACDGPDTSAPLDAGRVDAGQPRRDGGARDAGTSGGGSAGGGASGGGLPGPNVPPMVGSAIVAPMTSGWAGQLFPLSISATDANQDRLTFTWTQVSPAGDEGTFLENGSPNAQRWFSPELLTPTTFVLKVSVTDGRSPPEEREVTVMVRPPRFSEIYAAMLGVPVLQGGQCVGCHGSMGNYTVGSTANSAWSRLVNVAHQQGAGCRSAGLTSLVVPNDKARSLLYLKMAGTHPAACGDVMPRGTSAIPPSPPNVVVAIGTWIRLGAPND